MIDGIHESREMSIASQGQAACERVALPELVTAVVCVIVGVIDAL